MNKLPRSKTPYHVYFMWMKAFKGWFVGTVMASQVSNQSNHPSRSQRARRFLVDYVYVSTQQAGEIFGLVKTVKEPRKSAYVRTSTYATC